MARLSTQHATQASDYFRSVARLGMQAAEALDVAHQNGVLHRDIKPPNLMLDLRGNVWITDFGLARIDTQAGLTLTGDLVGTPRYMSPEQTLGERAVIDHRTDIYSLGATLYELVTLAPAVPGKNRQEILNRLAVEEPTHARLIDPAVPTDLATIVMKALAKSPADRYSTATALAADLRRFLNHEPIHARPPTVGQLLTKWSVRHKSLVVAIVATLLVSTLVLAMATIVTTRARNRMVQAYQELELALDEKQSALDREWAAQQRNYVADIKTAHESLLSGDIQLTRHLLNLHAPEPGSPDRRGFEWYYLRRDHEMPGQLLRGHTETVFSVSLSQDGRLLATASGDGTARLWRTDNGQLHRVLSGHTNDVNSVMFSPTEDAVVTASEDGTVGIWDPDSGERTKTLEGHEDMIVCAVYSPDGHVLTSCSVDGMIKTWDVSTGDPIASLQAHGPDLEGRKIHMVAVSPDGTLLASCAADQTVKVWTLPTLEHVFTFDNTDASSRALQAVAFQPGTSLLFAAFRSGRIRSWDTRTGARVHDRNTNQYLLGLAFSPDGRRLATVGGKEFSVRLLNPETLHLEACFSGSVESSWCAAFSRDGRYLAAGVDHDAVHIQTLPPRPTQVLAEIDACVNCMELTPDGRAVLVGCRDGTLRWLDLFTGEEFQRHAAHAGGVTTLRASPDGMLIATSGHDRTIKIWDRHGKHAPRTLTGFADFVSDIKFTADGRLAACDRIAVTFWDTGTWQKSEDWTAPNVRSIAIGASGGMVMAGWGFDYRTPDRKLVPINGLEYPVESMEVDSKGEMAAVVDNSNSPALIDFATAGTDRIHRVRRLSQHRSNRIVDVAVSRDGQTLAAIDGRGWTAFWNLPTRQKMLTISTAELIGLPDDFQSMCLELSEDDSTLVLGLTPHRPDDETNYRSIILVLRAPRQLSWPDRGTHLKHVDETDSQSRNGESNSER